MLLGTKVRRTGPNPCTNIRACRYDPTKVFFEKVCTGKKRKSRGGNKEWKVFSYQFEHVMDRKVIETDRKKVEWLNG